ncbi:MAG TPA: ribonuclease H-like domain-containing protein [Methanoregulaceae archaeon]|nr:ribonuclease H-like domain-containing protein [Methanoregulaceae archaeon]
MIPATGFDEVSRHWKLSARNCSGPAIARNDSVFRAGFPGSSILESQYRQLQEMKTDLEERYAGLGIGDVFSGEVLDTPDGSCFRMVTEIFEEFPLPSPAEIRGILMNDLTLVRGIGPVKAGLLRRRGYRSIEDLRHNKTFRHDAEICENIIGWGVPEEIIDLVRMRHPPSHPQAVLSSALHGQDGFLFVDLETLGFFSRPIILFGLAEFQNRKLVVFQYLVRNMEEELAALTETIEHVRKKPVVVSYNGKAFDLPYLISRSAFYGTSTVRAGFHIDLLHVSRRMYRGMVQDCRLATIERHVLDNSRAVDIPGSLVPEFYESYQRTGNPGPLIPVVGHNREDVVTLARLLTHVSGGNRYGC